MSDNIFDRLAELLSSPGPVNWALAAELGQSVAGPALAVPPDAAARFEELTRTAQLMIGRASALGENVPLPRIHVVDRRDWVKANLRGFRYLVEPFAAKMNAGAGGAAPLLAGLTPAVLGMQIGSMVGFVGQRVLGQFDTGLPIADRPGFYYVAPNIDEFTSGYRLDPAQTELWVALHEVAHHAEFSVGWVGSTFAHLANAYFDTLDLDPSALAGRLENLEDPEELAGLFDDPAQLSGLSPGPGHPAALARIQAFMAFMEGYADHLVARAGGDLLPELPRLAESLERRRAEPSQGELFLQRLMGLELKRSGFRKGSQFCAQIAERWGEDALSRVWETADHLPSIDELDDPVAWAARVLLD